SDSDQEINANMVFMAQIEKVLLESDESYSSAKETVAEIVDITQQFSAARTPQQNGVVERRNRTLVKAVRTMLSFANLPLFLWAEAIATTCFTQNHLIIHKHFDKTPYELMNKRKPNIRFFRVFGCRCYLLNDYEDVGKLKEKRDIGVSTMQILLLYRGEYSQWRERFMNYLEEQTDGEAMINSIQNGDQPFPVITQVSLAGNASNAPPTLKDPKFWTAKEKKTRKIDQWKQYGTLMRKTKNLMDINIDPLYNILNQNQGVVNDALGYKKKVVVQNQGDVNDAMELNKKTVVVTSVPLALIAEKMKVSKRKEEVVVSSDSEGSDEDDLSELKKINALLAKAFNRKKFYSKPINNNLSTSLATSSANKKQEYMKSDDKKEDKKKAKFKDYEYYKTNMLPAKKDKDEQVLLAEDHAWMEYGSDSNQEINANMVFMAQIEEVLLDSEASSLSSDDKIAKVSYYTSESEGESEYETLEYYDDSTTYGLFVDNIDDQEIFHDSSEFFLKILLNLK
nr:integrase, catalytic region, zinc finger, CCHC-type, peptidase aspartic, catalytic [Tanacetum cinerariifolium]